MKASPGLKAGRGLKRTQRRECSCHDCASPGLKAGRGLKLRSQRTGAMHLHASPGLKAGRGLKHPPLIELIECALASPGLKAGRGLKRDRIGTSAPAAACIARPQGRARIETVTSSNLGGIMSASPGLKAGRGLKPIDYEHQTLAAAHRPASRPGAD